MKVDSDGWSKIKFLMYCALQKKKTIVTELISLKSPTHQTGNIELAATKISCFIVSAAVGPKSGVVHIVRQQLATNRLVCAVPRQILLHIYDKINDEFKNGISEEAKENSKEEPNYMPKKSSLKT